MPTLPSKTTLLRLAFSLTVLALLSTLIFSVITQLKAMSLWDDAFMFIRYAHNTLQGEGLFVWNPGGAPVFGLTSLAFLGIVLPLYALIGNAAMSAALASLISFVAFIVLFFWFLFSALPGDRTTTYWAALFALLNLAVAVPHVTDHSVNGMDTLFSLCMLTLYMWAMYTSETTSTSLSWVVGTGILGGALFLVRPDLLLFSALVPLSLVFFSSNQSDKQKGWYMGITTVLTVGIILLCTKLYFGTPLPLPFYVKTGNVYGPHLHRMFTFVPMLQFIAYITTLRFIVAALLLGLVWRGRSILQEWRASEKGLAIASLLFIIYYLGFVLQIMPYHQRFFYPTFPVFLWLGARVVEHFVTTLRSASWWQGRIPIVAASGVLLIVLAIISPLLGQSAQQAGLAIASGAVFDHARYAHGKNEDGRRVWPCLEELNTIPYNFVIATTEVGRISVAHPTKHIIDIAGLHTPEFALHSFSSNVLFERFAPDIIYLPNQTFNPEMHEMLIQDPVLQTQYTFYPREELFSLQDVAIKKSNPYATETERLFDGACGKQFLKAQEESNAPSNDTSTYYLTLPFE